MIRRGPIFEELKTMVRKTLNNPNILVDCRNAATPTVKDEALDHAVRRARRIQAPIFIEQGAIGPLLGAIGGKSYWMFIEKDRGVFLVWEITGGGGVPKEHLITV